MKKKIGISLVIVLMIVLMISIVTNYADSGRVTTGHEPEYCIKIVAKDGSKVTYWGLGYKVIRYVGVSPNEPFESNIGVKMGNWLMQYNLPEPKTITIEVNGKTIEITNYNDVCDLENILENSKYEAPLCDGISTHRIIFNDEIYDIKESCKEIQKGDKQASITEEDLNTILQIVEKNQ